MLLKTADDKTADLVELESLLELPLTRVQRKKVDQEIWNVRMGVQGERTAAHHINHQFRDSDNTIVLHDLRIDVDGDVAQIDHLLLTRFRMVYVVETKNYGGRLWRSPEGNWACYYGSGKDQRRDIASPTEQARRHCTTLARWFKQNGLTVFDHPERVIMVQPDQRVPKLTGPDQGIAFIKSDNLRLWWEEQRGIGAFGALWRIATRISADDLQKVASALLESHVPLQRDWRARFGIASGLQPAGAQPEARASREPTPAPEAPSVSPVEPAPAPQAPSISTEQATSAPLAPSASPDTPARPAPTTPPPPVSATDGETLPPPSSVTVPDGAAIAVPETLGQNAAVPVDVVTPFGIVALKRVTDGRYALRYEATDELVDHVRTIAKELGGEWQARFKNWLVPADRIDAIVERLAAPIAVAEVADVGGDAIVVEIVAPVRVAASQAIPGEVATPHGLVTVKRIPDGRYALRHEAAEPLEAHVRGVAGGVGQWQARYRNWLVGPEHIGDVVAALGGAAPIVVVGVPV